MILSKKKHGPHTRVDYRRKRSGETDYHKRVKLLQSGKPRLVVRPSLKHVRAQVIQAKMDGDYTLASAFSKELSDFGWKACTSNTPSAYLVGLLCGLRAREAGINECILDIDRFMPTPGAKVFATAKGVLDADVEVPHEERVIPSEDRIQGEHIAEYAESLKSSESAYQSQFSNYLERDLEPEDLPEHFNQIKKAIIEEYGE
ncbi:MAG: 50S ribosomal protein L18 [Hadesarchaea archaeon]|nr:50S ribosomal protein L18 [Hadesarchaea archaeon]